MRGDLETSILICAGLAVTIKVLYDQYLGFKHQSQRGSKALKCDEHSESASPGHEEIILEDHDHHGQNGGYEESQNHNQGHETSQDHDHDPIHAQEVLQFLYLIAEDQSKRVGYIHRGVSCNYCGQSPIKGLRYHCSECADVDLCQKCESKKRHNPRHVLVKIQVPIPLVKSPRWIRKSLYPIASRENIKQARHELDQDTAYRLSAKTEMTLEQVRVVYERFMHYADRSVSSSECDTAVPYIISGPTFRELIAPASPTEMFARCALNFYDPMRRGLVRFEDFVSAVDKLTNGYYSKSGYSHAQCYDLEGNGLVQFDTVREVLVSHALALTQKQANIIDYDSHMEMSYPEDRAEFRQLSRPAVSLFGMVDPSHEDHELSVRPLPPKKVKPGDNGGSSILDRVDKRFIKHATSNTGSSSDVPAEQTADHLRAAYGGQAYSDMVYREKIVVWRRLSEAWDKMEWEMPAQKISPDFIWGMSVHGKIELSGLGGWLDDALL